MREKGEGVRWRGKGGVGGGGIESECERMGLGVTDPNFEGPKVKGVPGFFVPHALIQ